MPKSDYKAMGATWDVAKKCERGSNVSEIITGLAKKSV